MNAPTPPLTWQQCFDAGMTAPEAARIRGTNRNGPYSWSARHGVKWPRPPSEMVCPVRIRGIDYPSIAAAAKALRTDQSNICRHLALYGHADNVGKWKPGGRFGRPVAHLSNPVTIGHRTWPSRRALADHIGWSATRVVRALGKEGNHRLRANLLAALMKVDARSG